MSNDIIIYDMMLLSQTITNKHILSLRVGGVIANSFTPIINPNNLKIEGFYAQERGVKSTCVLLSQDIREILPQGFVVNDHEVLSDPEDLIRLKRIMEIGFELIGKKVVTITGKKLGKVSDYAVDSSSLMVQKLFISPNIIKSLGLSSLSIDRTHITEITDNKIVVKDIESKLPSRASKQSLSPA